LPYPPEDISIDVFLRRRSSITIYAIALGQPQSIDPDGAFSPIVLKGKPGGKRFQGSDTLALPKYFMHILIDTITDAAGVVDPIFPIGTSLS